MDEELFDLQEAFAGEYSLERELGRGGMGIVYLARDVQLDRLIAIKVLPRALASRADVRERFVREARLAARLSHPNIVPIHRVGEAAGLPYFAMAYVEGTTLGERLRERGPVPPRLMTDILRDVALALAYAHGHGIVHRDIKPDNILLEAETGRSVVTDFGIAAMRDDLADDGAAIPGTAQFMSPEQLLGERLDGRSDLYALGAVAYLALSGRLPHEEPEVAAMVARRVAEDVRPLAETAPEVPPALASIVDRCLRRKADERFPDAESVAAALTGTTRPARTTLPAALRSWASEPVPLLPLYAMWSASLTISAVGSFFSRNAWQGFSWMAIGMAAAPLIPIGIFEARRTYSALRAGYTLADLRLALRVWRAQRLAELSEIGSPRESGWTKALRAMIPTGFIVNLAATSALLSRSGYDEVIRPETFSSVVIWLISAGTWTAIGSVIALTTLGAPLLPPSLGRRWLGRIRSLIWNSPAGESIAAKLTPSDRAIAAGGFRPTELALNVALNDLFEALPDAYRENLDELPETVRRLTDQGTALREAAERIESEDIEGTAPALQNVRAQLGMVVAALERIRLGLLRLHGGMSDLQPLTTSLDAARSLSEQVGRLVGAQGEIGGSHPLALDVRTPTPV